VQLALHLQLSDCERFADSRSEFQASPASCAGCAATGPRGLENFLTLPQPAAQLVGNSAAGVARNDFSDLLNQ
jgi:hypothetical protein